MTTNMNLSLSLVREAYDNHIRPTLTGKKAKRADKLMARLMLELTEIDRKVNQKRADDVVKWQIVKNTPRGILRRNEP